MKHLDITFDFETTALCPTAAPISIGAVAWNRFAPSDPFDVKKGSDDIPSEFYRHIDLRSAFLDGFTFDADTAEWWSKQSEAAKEALLTGNVRPLKIVISDFFLWIKNISESCDAESMCLWSQGSDFDIAILRNICYRYGISIPVSYTNFRDHRTYILERGEAMLSHADDDHDRVFSASSPRDVYKSLDPLSELSAPHHPLFDCRKSIYSTWQVMQI